LILKYVVGLTNLTACCLHKITVRRNWNKSLLSYDSKESSFLHVLLFQAALRMHRELTQLVYRLEYFEQ